ncbi:hypothetical protein niasHS_007051 [Heterodera schachtii]|uniref:G-protein coupled receptors family 1 profile domain-containing protein n=1 Tax=Heterodera schachtii TaxID=97005 RepID=A0ABD2JFE4_HETSC
MRLHFVAVAVNRAHAVCFPINYAQKMNKKVVFTQCIFVHILAIISSSVYYEVVGPYYSWVYLIASFAFYSAIAVKLAWINASNRNWNNNETAQNSSTDTNSVRITALCFTALMFSMGVTLFNLASNSKWYNEFLHCDSHPIGQQLYYPIFMFLTLYYVLDELLLMALCKEMRVSFLRFIRKLMPFWKENSVPTTTVQSIMNRTQSRTLNFNRQVRENGCRNDYH